MKKLISIAVLGVVSSVGQSVMADTKIQQVAARAASTPLLAGHQNLAVCPLMDTLRFSTPVIHKGESFTVDLNCFNATGRQAFQFEFRIYEGKTSKQVALDGYTALFEIDGLLPNKINAHAWSGAWATLCPGSIRVELYDKVEKRVVAKGRVNIASDNCTK